MKDYKDFTLRIPNPLHAKLQAAAKREKRSLNSQLIIMLERAAADEDTDRPLECALATP